MSKTASVISRYLNRETRKLKDGIIPSLYRTLDKSYMTKTLLKKLMLKYLTEFKAANQNDLRPIYKTCLGVGDLQENLSQFKA